MVKITGIAATIASIKKEVEAKQKLAFERELDKTVSDLKEATPVDTGEARDGWYRVNNRIENDVEHIRFLNEGSSEQAPAHFIEQTIMKNPNLIVIGTIARDK